MFWVTVSYTIVSPSLTYREVIIEEWWEWRRVKCWWERGPEREVIEANTLVMLVFRLREGRSGRGVSGLV